MDKYSEAEIAKIINDCEILILPENIPIEEGLKIGNLLSEKPPDEESREETEDDFERFYLNSKEKRNETVAVCFSDYILINALFKIVLILFKFYF